MDDDDLFLRHMEATGVAPLKRRSRLQRKPGGSAAPSAAAEALPRSEPSDDDEAALFREAMRELGVVSEVSRQDAPAATDPAASVPAAPELEDPVREEVPAAGLADHEAALFQQAMADLDAVPEKDCAAEPGPPVRSSARLRKPFRARPAPEDRIDLHGLNREEALRRLARFVGRAAAERLRVVLVVTGKGWHSEDGAGVLRGAVERWIRGPGRSRVRSWSEAPRAQGGRGALLLYLGPMR